MLGEQLSLGFGAVAQAGRERPLRANGHAAPSPPRKPPGGRGPRRGGIDNLFLGGLPDEVAAKLIGHIADDIAMRNCSSGWPLFGRFHISVGQIGRFDGLTPDVIDAAMRIGRSAAARTSPFQLTFDRISSYPVRDRFAITLRCCEGLAPFRALRAAVGGEVMGGPYVVDDDYEPHITLFYHQRRIADEALPEPISISLRELVLIHSPYGLSRHIIQDGWRWSLSGTA